MDAELLKKINLLSLIVSTVLINLARIKLILGWDLVSQKNWQKCSLEKSGFQILLVAEQHSF